jgi:F420-non-reducing hydrogenase large subunit
MGLVDKNNKVNLRRPVRVVDTTAGVREVRRGHTPVTAGTWSRGPTSFPHLKKVGWKGFVDGQDSGAHRAAPLAS